MFTLAHLSDPHVPSPLAVDLRTLSSKRIFGYWSWQRRRIHIHTMRVLDALTQDLAAIGPDHVAVTGDLVNISLPSEFAAAARWLGTLGPADRVSVVPGNHDAYVSLPWDRSCGLWGAYMSSDDSDGSGSGSGDGGGNGQRRPPTSPADFPYVRKHGRVAIVGLCTAVPTPPGWASGRIGRTQLDRLDALLARLGEAGMCRVILLHHPPIEGDNPLRKRLTDAAALQDVIARNGAELLLHGHDHRCSIRSMIGPAGSVPAVGVPSASAGLAKSKPIGQYHLYGLGFSAPVWTIDLRVRRYNATTGRFEDAGGQRLDPDTSAGQTMGLSASATAAA